MRRFQFVLKNQIIDLRGQWAWPPTFEINLICSAHTGTCVPNLVSLPFITAEISVLKHTDGRTDRQGSIDLADDTEQENLCIICTMWGLPHRFLPVLYICTYLKYPF